MKRIVYLYGFVVAYAAFCVAIASPASAAFQQTYIRLDRQKASTATSGTVCAKPSGTGTESQVTVAFPSGFIVNTSLSAWTVSTTAIPSGATAWPGISTASSVSGQSVSFPSSDLTPGTEYCFRFTNASALTTPAAADDYNGSITTVNGSSAVIDSSPFALSVIANDQVTVTASVLPSSNDVDFAMTSAPYSTTTLNEDDTVVFTIHYKSNYTTTTPLTVEASWEKGTVSGSGTQIDIFDYDIGSATTADDGTAPVVDLVNRTITWDIAALTPSATDHTVTFSLSVRSSIPTQNQISTSVQATASVDSAQLHQEQLGFTIRATAVAPSATPTPTQGQTPPGPSATPAPGTTALPTAPAAVPSPTPPRTVTINTVNLTDVSDTGTVIVINSSVPTTYTLSYGTSPSDMSKRVTGLTPEGRYEIELAGLLPDTQYYFTVTVADDAGNTEKSDIFTFRTASKNEQFVISRDLVSIAFQQIPLTDALTESILMPSGVPFTIHLNTTRAPFVKDMYAKIQGKVLGITESKSPPPVEEVRLIELLPGVFSGDILSPDAEGSYTVFITIHDIYGGIHSLTAPYTFVVSPPITVINGQSGIPVEGATVIIQKYEENLKTYTPLPKGLSMDIKTDEQGRLRVILPRGKYLIDVSATGFQDAHKELVIDAGTAAYPRISLVPQNSIVASVQYVTGAVIDTCTYMAKGAVNAMRSPRVRSAALIAGELALLAFSVILLQLRKRRLSAQTQKEGFVHWLGDSMIIFCSDALVILSLLSLAFIIRYQGIMVSIPLILVTLLLLPLWLALLRDLWIVQTREG